jgi:hypothetical protein
MRLVEDMSGSNRDCGSMLSFLFNGVRLFGLLRQRGDVLKALFMCEVHGEKYLW